MAVGEKSEVIYKVHVLQLAPRCPLDPNSSVFCSLFMIQSMASRDKDGDRRHPCLTPVFIVKESVSCHARTTLHAISSYIFVIRDIHLSGIP